MEEEINYSSVVFKNSHLPLAEKKEEPSVYAEVKTKGPATAAPKADGEAAARSRLLCVSAVCLGILCVLLVGAIGVIVYFSMVMNEQRANLSRKSAENQQMSMQMSILENKTEELRRDRDNLNWTLGVLENKTEDLRRDRDNLNWTLGVLENKTEELRRDRDNLNWTLGVLENKTEELRRDRDNLNWTLGVILDFNTFRVNEHCPDKKCQPCLKNWIQFKDNCYLFHDRNDNWKSWQNSRRYCQSKDADLVVIDSLQEQEFISNHTQLYFGIYHGYWIGLQETHEQKWLWVDGRDVTLQYWLMPKLNTPGRCVLMMPGKNVTASWDSAPCRMENIFICETKVLIKSE